MTTAEAIKRVFESPNVSDSNGENANVVDVVSFLARSCTKIANAITPAHWDPSDDKRIPTSLTESMLSVRCGLESIATSIEHLAEAVERHAEATEK